MAEEIINRVSQSELIQINLEDYLPKSGVEPYDLVDNLIDGLILKEKEFRLFLGQHNWNSYRDKDVAIFCSADVIIPLWAYMLLTSKLTEYDARCHFGEPNQVREKMLLNNFIQSDLSLFKDARVLVKGCGSFEISPNVFIEVTSRLKPLVKSLMYGEACSSVPVFKTSAAREM